MKLFKTTILGLLILVLSVNTAQAQWRWGKFEKLDTTVSIPKRDKNSVEIDDDYFRMRMGLLGFDLSVEDDWRYFGDKEGFESSTVTYYEKHDHGTLKSIKFDLGLNNYLNNGEFPTSSDLHELKPVASTYVGITWANLSHLTDVLYLDWGLGISWYNFRFDNAATRIDPTNGELNFIEQVDLTNATKSKLKVTYLNFMAIPMFDLSRGRRIVREFREDQVKVSFSAKRGVRFGLGPYAGLRLGSKAKYVYRNESGRVKNKDKSSNFLNDFRYGLRAQLGINRFDVFFSYDFNELFEGDQSPSLNPITIGVTF